MELRLLLALLLTVPILFLGPYLLGPQKPQPEKKSTAQPSQPPVKSGRSNLRESPADGSRRGCDRAPPHRSLRTGRDSRPCPHSSSTPIYTTWSSPTMAQTCRAGS